MALLETLAVISAEEVMEESNLLQVIDLSMASAAPIRKGVDGTNNSLEETLTEEVEGPVHDFEFLI